ncbi:hypothetical protein AB6A40_011636 [Gnathostoma spinigerum]|uniref:Uncharacterized protein n=1 Tax=Gnathostoma spinigerum TaxID=75299 RepID=A0ABD6F0B6_9BILA
MFTYHWNQVIRRNKSSISNLPFGESGVHSPSVLLLGFDSLSRSNFIRVLPKTYAQMQKMNFVDMKHHVKVYDNTYGNMIAILTGLRGASSQNSAVDLFYGYFWRFYLIFHQQMPDLCSVFMTLYCCFSFAQCYDSAK